MVGACRAATSRAAFSGATNSNNLRSARWTRAGSSQRDERYHAKHVLAGCPALRQARGPTLRLGIDGFARFGLKDLDLGITRADLLFKPITRLILAVTQDHHARLD